MGILERQIREEEILSAAAKVFFAKGFGSAKMTDVAKEAKLSKGLVYFYYKSKEDLYMAVIHHAATLNINFFMETQARDFEGNGLEKLILLLRSYFKFSINFPYYQEALSTYISMMHPGKQIANQSGITDKMKASTYYQKIHQLQLEPLNILTQMLQAGIQDGSVKTKLNPVYLYMTIWSMMIGYEKLSIRNEDKSKDTDNPLFVLLDNHEWQKTITQIVTKILTTA